MAEQAGSRQAVPPSVNGELPAIATGGGSRSRKGGLQAKGQISLDSLLHYRR